MISLHPLFMDCKAIREGGRCKNLRFLPEFEAEPQRSLRNFRVLHGIFRLSSPGQHKMVANPNQRVHHAGKLHILSGDGGHHRHHLAVPPDADFPQHVARVNRRVHPLDERRLQRKRVFFAPPFECRR